MGWRLSSTEKWEGSDGIFSACSEVVSRTRCLSWIWLLLLLMPNDCHSADIAFTSGRARALPKPARNIHPTLTPKVVFDLYVPLKRATYNRVLIQTSLELEPIWKCRLLPAQLLICPT